MATKTILTPFQVKVLNEVAKDPTFIKRFYLTGGTALAEFHLHHRLSEDLDFFSEEEFSPYIVQAFVKKLVKVLKLTNTEYRVQGGLHIFILHRGKDDKLKIDFNYYPFPRVDKKLHYQKLEVDGIRDIAINKLQTIATTPRTRDFIDLYCIIQKTGWTIEELRKDARNKFDWYIDSVALGSKIMSVQEQVDYPGMVIPFDFKECEVFWLKEAQKLKKDIIEK